MYYPDSSSTLIPKLSVLKRFHIAASGLTEIDGIARMPQLEWIALLALDKLADFSGLTNDPSLRFVWIEGCRKLDLGWLQGMTSLGTLRFLECGKLEGIEALRSLPTLRHLHLASVGKVTEDLSFLRGMPNLESVFVHGMSPHEAEYWAKRNRRYDLLRSDVAEERIQ